MHLLPGLCLALLLLAPALAEAKPVAKLPAKATAKTAPKEMPKTEGPMGDFGGWRAFRYLEQGNHVCYMMAHPASMNPAKIETPAVVTGKGKKKKIVKPASSVARDAYVMLTFRPAESLAPVFNYAAGTGLKEGSEAALTIGKQKFSLFTAGNSAWARTSTLDRDIAAALKKTGGMEISAQGMGGKLRDSFTLKGAEQAYKRIATACGIPQ